MTAATGELYIGGRWRRGGGAPLVSISPVNGAVLWSGASASGGDIDEAVTAARNAFPDWRRTPLDRRIEIVKTFAALVGEHRTDLTALISREVGKPLWDAATETAAVIGKADLSVRAYTERTPTRESQAGVQTQRLSHHPHGVLAVLGPFNFPAHLPNGHIMPALIAGNAVIFKPSDKTPAVAEWMVRMWERAGLPQGVLNLVHGGAGPAQALVAHEDVDGVLFTGSVPAGRAIHAALAGKPEKILALELGGNNPLVVWNAADTDAAARIIVRSAFITSGQRCTCARRLIVSKGKDGERHLDALVSLIDRIIVDRPDAEPQPFIGPLISGQAASDVLRTQESWLSSGGVALRASRPLSLGEAYLSPGLIDVTRVTNRKDEETFGPLLQVIRVDTFGQALAEANATRFGLAAGLLSDDEAMFEMFQSEVRAGVLNWNRQTTGASGAAPFGGVGQSGNHRPAGFYAADYCAWPMASLLGKGAVSDAEAMPGIVRGSA
jgi:succinylglutamic semialdehyde dehydrogenase